jgi:hypothetical protein
MAFVSHAAVLETWSATQQRTAVSLFLFIYWKREKVWLASMIFSAGIASFDLIILTAMSGRHCCD